MGRSASPSSATLRNAPQIEQSSPDVKISEEQTLNTLLSPTLPSITKVRHVLAERTYEGPNGVFGSHQVKVTSTSTSVSDQQILSALLKLDELYQDESCIQLFIVYPANDGTGIGRGFQWVRPLGRIVTMDARATVPATDAFDEIGLAKKVEGVDRQMVQDVVDGTAEFRWVNY